MNKWFTSLGSHRLALTSVVVGSSPVHGNMLDALRTCLDVTFIIEKSHKTITCVIRSLSRPI